MHYISGKKNPLCFRGLGQKTIKLGKRNGGYVRILKMGFRPGDNAPLAYVELTEKPVKVEEVKPEETVPVKAPEAQVQDVKAEPAKAE